MSAGRGGCGRRIGFDKNAAFGPRFCCHKTSPITPRTLSHMARALAEFSEQLHRLSDDSRVTVRRAGVPDPNGRCVVHWMQRAQRGIDNNAVDLAVRVGSRGWLPIQLWVIVARFSGC